MDHFKALRTIVRTADEGGFAAAARDVRGHLRVLAPPAFVVHQLARRLPDFRRAHPQAPAGAHPGLHGLSGADFWR